METIPCSNMKWWTFLLVVMSIVSSAISKQYRTDYVYNKETDAFYKFHMEEQSFDRSDSVCGAEGAALMVPASKEDISQAHGMFKQYPDIGDMAWVGNDWKEHDKADETPIIDLDEFEHDPDIYPPYLLKRRKDRSSECDVIQRNGEVLRSSCYRSLPFICKVEAKEAFKDTRCKVFAKGYEYYENVGSCYKIPNYALTWIEAHKECRSEGGHLAVLNSELEHDVLHNLTRHHPSSGIAGVIIYDYMAIGVRADKKTDGSPVVFKTILNQTLEEAGYSQWDKNEPNNSGNIEYCGSISRESGKFNDIPCSGHPYYYGFICEKEVLNTK